MWVIGLVAAVVVIIIYPCLIAASRADDELEKDLRTKEIINETI